MDKILEVMMSNSEMLLPTIKEYINKYKPVVYDLAQEFVNICKDYSNNTEFSAIIAKTKKNMYDAYIAVGFSEDQALALMINDNIQLVKNIKQMSDTSTSIEKTIK